MPAPKLGFLRHPTSGETFAVRTLNGRIIEAVGPLNQNESLDAGCLEGWLENNQPSSAADAHCLNATFSDNPITVMPPTE